MSNPFKNNENGSYSGLVLSQIKGMAVRDSRAIDLGDKTLRQFRMTLGYVAEIGGYSFTTRVNEDGVLWVLRTK